jgi:hypothetical protein
LAVGDEAKLSNFKFEVYVIEGKASKEVCGVSGQESSGDDGSLGSDVVKPELVRVEVDSKVVDWGTERV